MFDEIIRIPLFSTINRETLKNHIENREITVQNFAKRAVVYNHKDLCDTLDLVLSGELVAYSLADNGSVMSMFEFKKDSMIGANLLYGENNAYPLNIYCLSDCRLLRISKNAVSEYLHDYSFVMTYVKSLSQNSRSMNQKLTMITQKKLRDNILAYLKKQSIIQETDLITLPVSKRELADYLGVQRPSLFRELKKLKDEGVIEVKNRKILIHISDDMI